MWETEILAVHVTQKKLEEQKNSDNNNDNNNGLHFGQTHDEVWN